MCLLFAAACAACETGDCSCAPVGMMIASASSSLVSASGCEHVAVCRSSSPCDSLDIRPPANGGQCSVDVSFSDGTSTTVTGDFGAMHPSTDCCGNFYDNGFFVVRVK